MSESGTEHRFHVTVDSIVHIDPEKVDEWVSANFDIDQEHVTVTDLTEGDGVSAPVVVDSGPTVEELVQEGDTDE